MSSKPVNPGIADDGAVFISSEKEVVLQNTVCAYCLRPFERGKRTREHAIGRRFVPEGKVRNSWNLLVYACSQCNNEKSRLEDEISAISMQPDAYGRHPENNADLIRDGERKGRGSFSSITKDPIAESLASASGAFSAAAIVAATFAFEGPPQVGEDRIARLAVFHVKALYFWLTYNKVLKRGSELPSRISVLSISRRSDWGNAQNVAFADLITTWRPRFLTGENIAGRFFKIALRRHPSAACWAWALEWNLQFRTVGFFGESAVINRLLSELPAQSIKIIARAREASVGFRRDVPLDPKADHLFAIPFSDGFDD